ncbi:MAG: methyltransferase domain-containing protein [Pseudomonadota bacterium]
MPNEKQVSEHYSQNDLIAGIEKGLAALGKTPDTVTLEDLGPVEEFHVGGRDATQSFLDQIDIQSSDHLLDVGCGIGGPSRFVATTYGCQVTGVDLTPDFIDAGNEICRWLGLTNAVTLMVGSALELPMDDASIDKAYMLHVGMNIADKNRLMQEVYRVLKPGGVFAIFDIMRQGEGDLVFPVPWASEGSGSSVASADVYKSAMASAGFEITAERNRHQFAIEFFETMQKKNADGPPPLGLHVIMGAGTPEKMKNVKMNLDNDLIAPVELIGKK